MPLARNDQVASIGPNGEGGLFVLLQGPSGGDRLVVAGGTTGAWQQLPSPPKGTATAVFLPGGVTEALVAGGTRFSVWSLNAGSKRWAEAQAFYVPIQYGSSS